MIEIRFHGRGGQGAVTCAELLAEAAINEGKFAQAFPSFGPERRGAPVMSFARIDAKKINLRSQIYQPDIVVVLDPTLLKVVDVTDGLKNKGVLIINTDKSTKEIRSMAKVKGKVATVNATKIALKVIGRAITNTVMLGALLKFLPLVKMESIIEVINEKFSSKIAENNTKALKQAYTETKIS